ncbi:MAG TPA: ubiquinol-cytochrome C chaperone family protein [Xanthobacteraceae bacterium]|jgi:cytochrome b pre-mRNA-processing protein 3
MIFRLFRRGPAAGTIDALYGAIVAQARRPVFYAAYGAPDTAEGRFDMVVLHLALVCRRFGRETGAEETAARDLSQQVFDMFCADMDHNLREMGVGDLTVPKKMRRMGEAFYGRLEVYDRALAATDGEELTAALARNVLGASASAAPARRFAAYVRDAARRLDSKPFAALAGGQLDFPDPGAIAAPVGEVAP